MGNIFTTQIKLSGLSCSACQKVVEKRLKKITGVVEVLVNLENGQVKIVSENEIDKSVIIKALAGTEYQVI